MSAETNVTNANEPAIDPEQLFVGEVVLEVPSVEDRYRYKKVAGSSDTKHTADEFE